MSCAFSSRLPAKTPGHFTSRPERTSVLLPCLAAGARASCARRAHSTNVRTTPDQQQAERPLKIRQWQQLLENMEVPDSHRGRHSPQRHFEGGVGDARPQSIPSKTPQFTNYQENLTKIIVKAFLIEDRDRNCPYLWPQNKQLQQCHSLPSHMLSGRQSTRVLKRTRSFSR